MSEMLAHKNLNLNQHELVNFLIHTFNDKDTFPSPLVGQTLYDTSDDSLNVYTSSGWASFFSTLTGVTQQVFSASTAPQNNLNDSGLNKLVFHTEDMNTITNASMSNSVITLPAGVYFYLLSLVYIPSSNNTGIGIGAKLNGSVLPIKAAGYDKYKGKYYSRILANVVTFPAAFDLEFYSQKLDKSGQSVSVNNSGGVRVLRVA